MATCPDCGAVLPGEAEDCPDCGAVLDERDRTSLVTVFDLAALRALASPAAAVADADRWSDHVRVVTAGLQFALSAFKQTHDVSQRFDPRWGTDRGAALAAIAAATDAERCLLVGAGPADEDLAAEHGWDYRAVDDAAAKAGWELSGDAYRDEPEGLAGVAVAADAAAGVAEELATALADLLTARRGLAGPRVEPFVLREYLTAVGDARAVLAELEVVADELASLADDAQPPESVADGTAELVGALLTLVSRARAFLEAAAVEVDLADGTRPLSEAVTRGLETDGDIELVVDAGGLDRAGRAFAEELEAVDARADELVLALEPEVEGASDGANGPEPG